MTKQSAGLKGAIRAMLLAGTIILTGSAFAQQQFVGTWRCDFANESLMGNDYETWMYSFDMALSADGQFQLQGQYWANSAGYWEFIAAGGQWTAQDSQLTLQGQIQHQSGALLQFGMGANQTADNVLTYRQDNALGRLTVYCERQLQ